MAIFKDRRYRIVRVMKKTKIPDGLWTKCTECGEIVYNKKMEENLWVCPKCDFHLTMGAYERIKTLTDANSFTEFFTDMESGDPLGFEGPKKYVDKLKNDQKSTGLKEAAVCGEASIEGKKIALGVTDSRFIMGSMGSVVGEKITRIVEYAGEKNLPLIIVSGSGGGARMYEGVLSLMQMAKTSAALQLLHQKGGLFISVLTNPTMAGVMASFASLGDVIIAEPRALIGFTGPRVIEQTIHQKLPDGFQRSEFMLEHGMVDMVVHRMHLREEIARLCGMLCK